MSPQHEPDRIVLVLAKRHLQTAAIIVAGLAVGAVLFLVMKPHLPTMDRASSASPPDSVSWLEAPLSDVATEGRPALGTTDASVTIVEFTDYGCGVCRRHASEVLPALLDSLGSEIRYVVRHFPIPALTPNGTLAAIAAECAHRQDRFFEYKSVLSESAPDFRQEELLVYADLVGLDRANFGECLTDEDARKSVERDILDGWEHGVTGTPTFFVNGRRFQGARPLEQLAEFVRLAGLETESSPAINQ